MPASAGMAQAAAAAGVPLRDDLQLHPGAPFADGAPSWAIQDPVSNRFYRIGWLEYECLLRWHLPPAQIAAQIRADGVLDKFVQQRYRSFDSGIGKKIDEGKATFSELETYMLDKGEAAANESGRQEYLENVINDYL